MYSLIRKILFLLPPETAHHFSLRSLKLLSQLGLMRQRPSVNPTTVMGIEFPNRVGLAAGLDKNGEYIDALAGLGFGFIEIGTVTPRPQDGKPQPRLFRLPQSEAIINRMGFNNKGIDYLIEQVKQSSYQGVLGINIGKNLDTAVENSVDDYLICLKKAYPYASYITINISSPNTPDLRTLQHGDELQDLLSALKQEQTRLTDKHKKYTPIAVKVAPDLELDDIKLMAAMFLEHKIDCLIATNTTISREGVTGQAHAEEIGGLSGKPVTQKSTEVIRQFHQILGDQVPIIGVGGISSTQDVQDKMAAGASLVQVYTGFVYQGAGLIKRLSDFTGLR